MNSKSGKGLSSISKILSEIKLLMESDFDILRSKGKIHQINSPDRNGIIFSKYRVAYERAGTGETKIGYFRVLICKSNADILSKKYNNNSWRYLILITGFGNFHNLGTSESKLYDHLRKKLSVHLESIEFIFKIFNEPFTEEIFSIAIDIIEKSYDSFCGLRDDPYSMLPISNLNSTSHY